MFYSVYKSVALGVHLKGTPNISGLHGYILVLVYLIMIVLGLFF